MKAVLPGPPKRADKRECGICESLKTPAANGVLVCDHCDQACPTAPGTPCGICEAGKKGLR